MPSARSRSPWPMPESSSSFGELIEPPETMTSPRGARLVLLAVHGIAHADATLALEDEGFGDRALVDLQVGAAAGGIEIAEGRALAAALGDRHLGHADAFLRGAVLVGIVGQAHLLRRLDHLLQQRDLVAWRVGHGKDAVAATEFVGAALEAFHALEDGQHVLEAPAAIAELRPVIVVLRLAADVDHAVDRAGAAQHAAAVARRCACRLSLRRAPTSSTS